MKQYMIAIKHVTFIEREYANLEINFIGGAKLNLTCQNEDVATYLMEFINHDGYSMLGEINSTIIIDEYGNILNKDGKITKKK